MKLKFYSLLIIATLAFSSCTYRLVDFTVISSKNVNLDINKASGIKVQAEKSYFLGLGWNIKDVLDIALEKAGPNYDLLVDGVVRYSEFPFVLSVSIEGTAVDSRAMKQKMGTVGFEKWLEGKKVLNAETTEKNNEQ
jgi:hypothetical protein